MAIKDRNIDIVYKIDKLTKELNMVLPETPEALKKVKKSILGFICLILEKLVANCNRDDNLEDTSQPKPQDFFPDIQSTPEPEPSSTAKDLMGLRDSILAAKIAGIASASDVLEGMYYQLGQILENEDVISFEDTGMFDSTKQKIMGTEMSDDSSKNDTICSTIRPGYLFQEKVIRPQEIIVYTYNKKEN